jgi:hypothetical protein
MVTPVRKRNIILGISLRSFILDPTGCLLTDGDKKRSRIE